MKKLALSAIIAITAFAATPAKADSLSFNYYSYDPYVAYSYLAPPVYYYAPSGYYVQRHVMRPAPRHIFRHSGYHRGWYDRGHRRHDRGHDNHRHGHHRR